MIDLRKGAGLILPLVAKKIQHQDYLHVVDYAEAYCRPLATGKNLKPLIERFNKRESEADHDQRVRLTVATSPAVLNTIMGPVRKIARVKPNVNRADFGLDRKEDTEALAAAERKFYAGKDVKHWLGTVGFDAGALDPNSFGVIAFDKFDGRYQKPRVYPTIISCKDAWNFEYFNGELQWLLVHRDITYTEKPHTEEAKKKKATDPEVNTLKGNWFCAYLDNHHMMFTQVDRTTISSLKEGLIIDNRGHDVKGFEPGADTIPNPAMAVRDRYYFRVSAEELYEVVFYEHKSNKVQAFRMGYKFDAETDNRTCVASWHAAMPFLLKGIKAGSELDITASLHAFLKELSYVPRCPGYVEVLDGIRAEYECIKGKDSGGHTCRACGGSGQFRIQSGQDHITFDLPRNPTEILDLTKLHTYAPLPVEFLVWQGEYKEKMDKFAYGAVYNSEPLDRAEVQPTATAEIKDNENVYDTLQPGCAWFAETMMLIRQLMATYTVKNMDGFVNQFQFPRNLRFESLGNLVGLAKAMKDASASDALMIQIERDIMDHVFVDDQQALMRARTMVAFDPFGGKDSATILSLISQDLATKADKVFWTNIAKVFNEAEDRSANPEEGDPVDFYELTRPRQKELIDAIVAEIMAELDKQAEEAHARMGLGVVDPDADPEGEPGAQPPKNDPTLPTPPANGKA